MDLTQALTHISMKGEANNEKLELLGDAVLRLAVTEWLMSRYPDKREGDMAKILSAVVSTAFMSERFRDLGSVIRCRCAISVKMECDALEAIIGAVYQQEGYSAAQQFIADAILNYWDGNLRDYKTELQELHPTAVIKYYHDPFGLVWRSAVTIDGRVVGEGTGNSRKEADQHAAKQALGK